MSDLRLIWAEEYSVGVEELDNQHKRMFTVINELLDAIDTNTTAEHLGNIIDSLIKYKIFHFSTEERYFKEYNYDGAGEHMAKHKEFNDKLTVMKEKFPEYNTEFALELADFLEGWLIDHLMIIDKKYTDCFHAHGLK